MKNIFQDKLQVGLRTIIITHFNLKKERKKQINKETFVTGLNKYSVSSSRAIKIEQIFFKAIS